MSVAWILAWAGAAYATGLAAVVLWRAPRHPAHVSFTIGMVGLAAESPLAAFAAGTSDPRWQIGWLASTTLTTVPWLFFSFCYSRGDHPKVIRRWGPAVLLLLAGLVALIAGFHDQMIDQSNPSPTAPSSALRLGSAGVFLNLVGVIAGVAILTNLERTFRGSVGVMRWRIKYVILGLGTLFVFKLFRGSQTLLYSSAIYSLQAAEAGTLLVACGLMSVGLVRTKLFDVDIYPSHSLLVRSLTILLSGIYLVVVGILAQVVRFVGKDAGLPLQAFLILLALVGLAMALLSERFRRRLHQFVARNFRRPVHDYRLKWMTFTAQTAVQLDEGLFCRAVVHWAADTFRALSVNLWLPNDDRDRLRLGGSTVLTQTGATHLGNGTCDWTPLIQTMLTHLEPVDIDASNQPWLTELRRLSPGVFPEAGTHVFMPLSADGEFLGLITLGDRVGGEPFSTEDRDLLKCVGDQVAAGLLKIALSKRLLGAKELEAFQTMSAFFVHDLKNTASTLSLMLQNLRDHFGNPEFREDALRAVGKSVQHLDELIGRLSQLRQDLSPRPVEADLAAVTRIAIGKAGPMPRIQMVTDLTPGLRCQFDPEQIEKVILNLVLNARDAVVDQGEIRVGTGTSNGWAILSVTDNGCGMPPEFVQRSLFRPFQTTKKRGIGIGMFQSKMIMNAHRGRIEVESSPGRGTTFHVMLPLT